MLDTATLAAMAIFLVVLLLAQSRTAWLSLGLALGVVAAARWRPARVAAGAVLIGVIAVVASGYGDDVAERAFSAPGASIGARSGELRLDMRTQLWKRALQAVSDFPITGVGLGAFRKVLPVLYPSFGELPAEDLSHAHNIFLQTALDVGLPGLAAYLVILSVAGFMCATIVRRGDRPTAWLGLGLAGNLLAAHVFGLTDAIALGAKVGLFFWLSLGLIAAAFRLAMAEEPAPGVRL